MVLSRRRRSLAAVGFAALLFAADARADELTSTSPKSPERIVAGRLEVKRGREEAAKGDWEAALAHFRAAQSLVPEANLPYRYAAEALENLSRWSEAVEAYEAYLRTKPGVSDTVPVQARVAYLRSRYILSTLRIECPATDYRVYVDSSAVATIVAPMRESTVNPGEHTVELVAEGYPPLRVTARFEAGRPTSVSCDPRIAPSVASAPPPDVSFVPPPPPPSIAASPAAPPLSSNADSTRPSTAVPWLGFGIAGGLAVAGAVTGALALGASSSVSRQLDSPVRSPSDFEGDRTEARALAITTDVLLGAAIVTAGISLVVMLTKRHEVPAVRAREHSSPVPRAF